MKKKLIFLAKIFFLSFAFNFVWEHSHGLLYGTDHGAMDFSLYMWFFFLATLFDAGFITVLYLVMAVLKREFFWLKRVNIIDYFLVILISLGVAVWIEIIALSTGRWSYNELMPIVPVLGVGLTPFVQLAIISIVVFYILKKPVRVSV